jgi:hypothetical protein
MKDNPKTRNPKPITKKGECMTQTEQILHIMASGRHGVKEAIALVTNDSQPRKENTMAKAYKTRTRIYTLRVYDVWGNEQDGYDVNDTFTIGEVRIRCRAEVHNPGMPSEFIDYVPTERQLALAVGEKGLVWSGESDDVLFAETKRGKPVCELRFERFVEP